MKSIIITCCLLVASIAYSSTQQTAPVHMSKSDFSKMVKDLNTMITQNKMDDANKKYDELTKQAYGEMSIGRDKMRTATDETAKKKIGEKTMNQRNLMAQTLQMKTDMAGNRKALIEKLDEFANTLD